MDLKEKFTKELATEEWIVMAPHFKRDCLLMIAKDTDMVTVAVALATDNAPLIQQLLTEQKISRPSLVDTQQWEDNKTVFEFLIVQPFVIARPV